MSRLDAPHRVDVHLELAEWLTDPDELSALSLARPAA
jgi:hypothetical protein